MKKKKKKNKSPIYGYFNIVHLFIRQIISDEPFNGSWHLSQILSVSIQYDSLLLSFPFK